MISENNNIRLVDYIFWTVFIIFTNPGGILQALGENSGDGGIDVSDLLFVIMLVCFISIFKKDNYFIDKSYRRIVRYLFIFSVYYIIVFGFFVPVFKDNLNYSFLFAIIKNRYGIINVVLVVFVYEFYLRSYAVFFKYFIYSSLLVITLFLISVLTGIEIIPVLKVSRRFAVILRLVMRDYGLMPLLIPMGVVVIIFKFDIKYKKLIVIGFLLMFIAWLLGLFRRHIFGTFLYFIPASMLSNYIQDKVLISLKRFMSISFYLLILGFIIQLSFPKYVEAGYIAGRETLHIVQYGENTSGKKDNRLGLGKEFMQNIVLDNPLFGTGFDNRWRTLDGDKAGFEATDYPFIGALAMTGVFGLLFFLPIYIVLFKTLIIDIKYLKKKKFNKHSFETYILVLFIVYFIFDFMQYMNWFLPISIISDKKWYVFLAMYLASRKVFYIKEKQTSLLIDTNNIKDLV